MAARLPFVYVDGFFSQLPAADDIDLAASYVDMDEQSAPSNPSSGTRRLFVDSANNSELSILKSSGDKVSLETGTTVFLRGHIDGFLLSNNISDSAKDLDVSEGQCRDSTNAENMAASAFTKQIDFDWAVGTNAGGFPSGLTLTADTKYHVFCIRKSDGTIDFGFDSDIDATNLLSDSGYSEFRRLGSVLVDGSSNITGFSQVGDKFLFNAPILDVSTTTLSTTAVLFTLSVPLGAEIEAIVNVNVRHETTNTSFYISSPDADDQAPSISISPLQTIHARGGVSGVKDSFAKLTIRTDTSSRIRARASGSSSALDIATLGWIDLRGKE